MHTLHVNVQKLSANETVRYSGPATGGGIHGVYTLTLIHPVLDNHSLEIHFSLEAIMQLKQRVDAAFQHMITH